MRALMMLVGWLCAVGLLSASAVGRQADRLERVARYVDDVTVLAVEVDVERLDTDAVLNDIARTIADLAREQDPTAVGKSDEAIVGAKKAAGAWRAAFKAAGGRYLYLLVQFNPSVSEPFMALAPLAEGADADAAKAAVRDLPLPMSRDPEVVEGVVVSGTSELRRGKPTADAPRREELAKAFSRAGDAPIRIALIPSETVRRALAENLTQLPAELGGGPTEPLTTGIVAGWGSLAIPPAWSLKLVLETPSEDQAKGVAKALDGILKVGRERGDPVIVKPMIEVLVPRAEGNLVVIAAGAEKFERLKRAAVPAMAKARAAARRAVAASNVRQQVMGCLIYAQDHNNEWPASLQVLVDSGVLTAPMLLNPERPELKAPFAYVRPAPRELENADWSSYVIVHEVYDAWPAAGIWVGFADGHVQMVTDEAWFRERLAEAKKRSAK
jgi:hypothetical protein